MAICLLSVWLLSVFISMCKENFKLICTKRNSWFLLQVCSFSWFPICINVPRSSGWKQWTLSLISLFSLFLCIFTGSFCSPCFKTGILNPSWDGSLTTFYYFSVLSPWPFFRGYQTGNFLMGHSGFWFFSLLPSPLPDPAPSCSRAHRLRVSYSNERHFQKGNPIKSLPY